MARPQLHVIVGSTRPSRNGLAVSQWFTERSKGHGSFDITLVDLAEVNLPLMDEPDHPRLQKYTKDHTKKWSALVTSADAFVFVSPEYNHGPSPALINALDYLGKEWSYAPAAFVSYGAVSGGTRAVASVKPMLSLLRMMVIPESVIIPFVDKHIDNGVFGKDVEPLEKAVKPLLDELLKWTTALAPLRATVR